MMHEAQFSTFLNTVAGSLEGIQTTALANSNTGKSAQLAGFLDIMADDVSVLQAAGYINVTFGFIKDAHLVGFANVVGDMEGFQGVGL